MKLSIVVVNWNVCELLRKCLESIFRYPPKGDFEVFVVDNASSDDSVGMISRDFPMVKIIANDKNLGFATANNQAIRKASGEYILVLNPDTELRDGSIDKMIEFLDRRVDVGVVAPRLLNSDDSIQESIRRFPTFWSEFFILSKLYKLFPKAGVLRQYLAKDFDYSKDQSVEQPMGACFMVRRSVLNKAGLFDEGFFLWFEEVDLQKRIIDAGFSIFYLSSAEVVHVGGQSFKQQFTTTKQKIFNASRMHYFKKHGSWWQVTVFSLLNPLIMLAVNIAGMRVGDEKRVDVDTSVCWLSWNVVFGIIATVVLFEELSWWGYGADVVNTIGWIGLVVLALVLSLIRLEWGVLVQIMELIIGSKGHLFDLGPVSVRMGVFGAVFLGWLIYCLRDWLASRRTGVVMQSGRFFKSSLFKYHLLLSGVFAMGVGMGFVNNPIGNVVADANAWIFFLVAPVWYDAITTKRARQLLLQVAMAGIIAQSFKTLFVVYIMGHTIFWQDLAFAVYRWIRETGVGEITQIKDSFYRVFFQSQIYTVSAFFVLLSLISRYFVRYPADGIKGFLKILVRRWDVVLLLVLVLSGLLLSFSRSFWLAVILASGFWCVWFLVACKKWRALLSTLVAMVVGTIFSIGLIAGVSLFPYPSSASGFTIGVFGDRLSDLGSEAAVASRWNLLPEMGRTIVASPLWGYGFGKDITYYSKDPRVLEVNPTGEYTTFSFEWGYLDFVVKIGIIGLMAYGLLLWSILKLGWKSVRNSISDANWNNVLIEGVFWGLVALLAVHVFTPYLNHPLGIGLVVLSGLLFEQNLDGEKDL